MSTRNGLSFVDMRNINLKGASSYGTGVIRFDPQNASGYSSNPFSTDDWGLYVNSSGQLVFSSLGSTTVLGSGGGGGTPSWETLFANDQTFTITPDSTFTITGNRSTGTAVLTLGNIAGGSGAVLAFSNLGSGADILGTSSTWQVSAAGVATLAGISISGTSSAIVSTGAAVWTLKDNDSAALSIGSSGSTTDLVFDTTNGSEKLVATVRTFSVIANSNTLNSLLITNNTATTFGTGGASAGVAVFRSTSLTTGTLVRLQLTEGTLNGGYYLDAFDATGAATVFSVGEDGATVIAGAGGSDMFTVTAGDVVISDGSITLTDADDAASFSLTNNSAATATLFKIAGSGTFTGSTTTSFVTITPSGLTTGTAVYMPLAAMTTGIGVNMPMNALTTGQGIILSHTTSVIADGGSMLRISSTGVDTGGATNGTLLDLSSTAQTAGVIAKVATALTTGGALLISSSAAMTTTGYLVTLTANSATTAAGILRVNGNSLTSGIGVVITSSATAITGAGRLLRVDHTGVTGTSAILSEFASAANDETVIVKVTASDVNALGTALQVSTATTTGNGITVTANAITDGFGISVTSSNTTMSSTGRLLNVSHSGNAGVSAVIAEIKSAAADETVVMQVLASAALAAGKVVNISAAAVTTGNILDISDNTAHTTGTALKVYTNSADTGTRVLVDIKQDHASASGATPLRVVNDGALPAVAITAAATSTNYFPAIKANGVTIWIGNGTTANGNLSGTAGDICLNAGSNKPEYCTGTTNWTALV